MLDKIDHRKKILEQLLEKSELFDAYFKNQQTMKSIMNISIGKRNQLVQFGKCQINLPEKVKTYNQKFSTSKIMILTKKKKQAATIGKQKYENQKKLKQTQNIRLNLKSAKSQRNIAQDTPHTVQNDQNIISNPANIKQEQNQSPKLQQRNNQDQNYIREIPDVGYSYSPQGRYSNNTSQIRKQTGNQMMFRNRACSAKVRPQFDLFLKYKSNGLPKYRSSFRQQISHQRKYQRPEKNANLVQKNQYSPQKIITHEQQQLQNLGKQQQKQPKQINLKQSLHKFAYENTKNQQFQNPNMQIQSSFQNYSAQKRESSFSVKKYTSSVGIPLLVNKNYQQSLQQEKKNKIIFRRQLHKTYNRAFIPPPKISAKAYVIYEMKQQGNDQSGKILATANGKNGQEIASLTKIMTCIIVLEIGERLNINLSQEEVEIGKFESNITGTSAHIKCGQVYTIQQLLYGLMLPSGNDASLALGVWGGRQLIENDLKSQTTSRTKDKSQQSSSLSPMLEGYYGKKYYKKDYILRFIIQMNLKANSLDMTKTNYANTHGLVNNQNRSSAIDIALLCEYAMNNQRFGKIVGTRHYNSTIKFKEQSSACTSPNKHPQANDHNHKISPFSIYNTQEIKYQNSHYLLHKKPSQYIGIKTGVTNVAGPCLASCVYNKQTNRKFIIVVLDCKNMMMRFKETEILKKWLYKQQNLSYLKSQKSSKNRANSLKEDKGQMCSQMDNEEVDIDEEDYEAGKEQYKD